MRLFFLVFVFLVATDIYNRLLMILGVWMFSSVLLVLRSMLFSHVIFQVER